MPRVAIVGAGLMGRWHGYYAHRHGGRVVAVVDRESDRAGRLAATLRGARPVVGGPKELRSLGLDAVHVCVPSAVHAEWVVGALDAGLHVLVEKPLARAPDEIRELWARAERADRRLAAVHQLPFQRGFRRMSERRSELGALSAVSYRLRSAGGRGRAAEERREILLEIVPHPVSLFRALGLEVSAGSWTVLGMSPDELRLEAYVDTTRLGIDVSLEGRPTRHELVLEGRAATGNADLFHGDYTIESWPATPRAKALAPFRSTLGRQWAAVRNLAGRALRREPAYPGLSALIAAFYESLGGGEAPVGCAEAVAAAELAEHCRELGCGT